MTDAPIRVGDQAAEEGKSAPNGNRLFALFFRPRAFFGRLPVDELPKLTGLACYVLGVSSAIDQIDLRVVRDDVQGRARFALLADDWSAYWLAAVLAGVVSALLLFLVGGWWYHRRLQLCGAIRPDKLLARRVFVFASLVWALPAVAYTAWSSAVYPSPRAASEGEDWGSVIVLGCLFWSVLTSYRGATTVFQLRRWAARVWFLILPAALYASIVLVTIAAFASGLLIQAPDVARPRRILRPGFELAYPGNWQIDKEHTDFDPDGYFTIEPPFADAVVTFHIGADFENATDALETYRVETERSIEKAVWLELDRWGSHAGKGLRGSGTIAGHGSYAATIFAAVHEDGRVLVVREICASDVFSRLEPGVELIRRTFAWR